MAALTPADTFDSVNLLYGQAAPTTRSLITELIIYRKGVRGYTRINGQYFTGDLLSDEDYQSFLEVKRRVENGTCTVYYPNEPSGRIEEHDVKPQWEWMFEWDPFKLAQKADAVAVGPATLVVFKWFEGNSVGPADITFDGKVENLVAALDSAGWNRKPSAAPNANNTLAHIAVTYWQLDGETGVVISDPATTNIQYSADAGRNWATDPPSDFGDRLDDSIMVHDAEGWVEVDPNAALAKDDSEIAHLGSFHVLYNFPHREALSVTLNRLREFVVAPQLLAQWDPVSDLAVEGYGHMPADRTDRAYPSEISEAARNAASGKMLLIKQHKTTGETSVTLDDDPDLSDYADDYYCFLCCVEAYPGTTLSADAGVRATALTVASARGIAVGDTLFIGDDQVSVTAIPDNALTVSRGTDGPAHTSGDEVRAIINRDAQRYFVVWTFQKAYRRDMRYSYTAFGSFRTKPNRRRPCLTPT